MSNCKYSDRAVHFFADIIVSSKFSVTLVMLCSGLSNSPGRRGVRCAASTNGVHVILLAPLHRQGA